MKPNRASVASQSPPPLTLEAAAVEALHQPDVLPFVRLAEPARDG
ncbi:hypothetical protein ACGFYQ_35010 [Streptomyces sp. NPDC048258]